MRDSFNDLETFSPVPIKDGTHRYAEKAEVMLWAYALEDDDVKVWDKVNGRIHWQEDLSGVWVDAPCKGTPVDLEHANLRDPDTLVWFQNGQNFDFVVLAHAEPKILGMVPMERRRDTMVQAFAHALPGALEKLGSILNVAEEDRKQAARGKKLIRLFCVPQNEAFIEKHGTDRATKQSHPAEWQEFIQYAGSDIRMMRVARRLIPQWNYSGKQIQLSHIDCKINNRGFAVDLDLIDGAIRAEAIAKADLAREVREQTNDEVQSATQRDVFLEFLRPLLAEHGVDLPDLRADTLERRRNDPDLPSYLKDLIDIRLRASMNSVSKFKTIRRAVSADGRMRGCHQFRGAGRTGRVAHRLVQPGNMPRPTMKAAQIKLAIAALKTDCAHLIFGNVMSAISNTIRGVVVAPPGRKLVVADLSNIEGRFGAWLAGEEWKLQAFRDFDNSLVVDMDGKPVLNEKGDRQYDLPDLYIVAYAKSFNVPPESVPKKGDERQIGKVEELMFQYGGGVGAWLTGAATYGIDLDKMTEQVYPVLPAWALEEAESFLQWLYGKAHEKLRKALAKIDKETEPDAPNFMDLPTQEQWDRDREERRAAAAAACEAACLKARMGLTERTFVACDAIKRLWRTAHPKISSYWKEIEDTVRQAINEPGHTLRCRKVKIRCAGAWLRVMLPSGRELCYPHPKVENDGTITFTGLNQYTRQWCRISSYGGKFFENFTQAGACDQLIECWPMIEDAGYEIVMHVHDENLTETPDDPRFTADELSRLMCSSLSWNGGLPLAAAGYEDVRYRKE